MVTAGYETSVYGEDPTPLFNFMLDPEMVVGIEEEVDRQGKVLRPPRESRVADKTRFLLERGAQALVVSLRRASLNPENERQVKRLLDLQYPPHYLGSVPVLLSHQVSLRPEDAWRTHAAVINAYLHGQLARSLYRTEDYLRQESACRPLLVVHFDGGTARVAKTRAIDTYNSGPTAAIYGAATLARHSNLPRVLTLDVGGTSSDIGRLVDGVAPFLAHGHIEGFQIGRPILDIDTLGGGGGSLAKVENGSLVVGPESAGVLPGPACFGLGGSEPTVTDAFVVLGHLDPGYFLGGRRRLDASRSVEVIGSLARQMDLSAHQAAARVIRKLEQNITRVIQKRLGTGDLSSWVLFAFGGGGGLHAAAVAEALGISKILSFPFSSVFSAFGSSTLDVVHVYETCFQGGGAVLGKALPLGSWFQVLVAAGVQDMEDEGFSKPDIQFELQIEMQGPGSLPVLYAQPVDPSQRELPLEIPGNPNARMIMARLRTLAKVSHYGLSNDLANQESHTYAPQRRTVYWRETPMETPVYRRDCLSSDDVLGGPGLIESRETTLAVPPGWSFSLDQFRNGILEKSKR